MKRDKLIGRSAATLAVFLFVFLSALGFTCVGDAAVTLKSYDLVSGKYEYMVFGRYPQSSGGKVGVAPQPTGVKDINWIEAPNAQDNDENYYYLIEPI